MPISLRVLEKHSGTANITTFEDAFLRSVLPGLAYPPVGFTADSSGVYFDADQTCDLENILQTHSFDQNLLIRAQDGIAYLQHYGISKYSPVPRGYGKAPKPGYILVIDQLENDASIAGAMASSDSFSKMLDAAKSENPDKQIIIRSHPAVRNVKNKSGHFSTADECRMVKLMAGDMNPWDILAGAKKVYCVSSQMGFEAILAGHKPVLFGVPFYAGWGLSDDRVNVPRRDRQLSAAELFAATMLVFPHWYDACNDRACDFEISLRQLHAQAHHHWDSLRPNYALGMRLWKRRNISGFLDGRKITQYYNIETTAVQKAASANGKLVVWAGKESDSLREKCKAENLPVWRMEDGFIRSAGLGAKLTQAASLVLDDTGIYYDPSHPSRLEILISASPDLPDFAKRRAAKLRQQIVENGISKYNLVQGETLPTTPENTEVILVPGQVEDDASIVKGGVDIVTNLGLLKATRKANPDAYIIYKPHPDVQAGLRLGQLDDVTAAKFCNCISNAAIDQLLDQCGVVWTITSLTGFEALLRNKKVTCLGRPFYAGWGLTTDLAPDFPRRKARPNIDELTHATLIDYPRYMDPVSGLPCAVETVVQRMRQGKLPRKPALRLLAKLQGIFTGFAFIWR